MENEKRWERKEKKGAQQQLATWGRAAAEEEEVLKSKRSFGVSKELRIRRRSNPAWLCTIQQNF
jgi:hypothetical protein